MPKSKHRILLNRGDNVAIQPIEKKLIGWSLGIGVLLLVVLAVANHLFPIAP
jgi:hypothetical protein